VRKAQKERPATETIAGLENGAGEMIRTPDLLITNEPAKVFAGVEAHS
jgi:hypothetical protein